MLKLRENGLTIDYMYETNSVLRKTAETEISDLTFWLRFGSVRVFINRNRTEIRFPHIPSLSTAIPQAVENSGPTLLRSRLQNGWEKIIKINNMTTETTQITYLHVYISKTK